MPNQFQNPRSEPTFTIYQSSNGARLNFCPSRLSNDDAIFAPYHEFGGSDACVGGEVELPVDDQWRIFDTNCPSSYPNQKSGDSCFRLERPLVPIGSGYFACSPELLGEFGHGRVRPCSYQNTRLGENPRRIDNNAFLADFDDPNNPGCRRLRHAVSGFFLSSVRGRPILHDQFAQCWEIAANN